MGGGASKGAGKSGATITKALQDERHADALFDQLDRDGDRCISMVELYDAVTSYGEAVQAYWTLDMIKETVGS